MIRTTLFLSMAAVLSALAAAPALADVPPPPDYVESCTVAKQESATTECLACAAYYGATTRCQTMLASYCYSKVCNTRGASAWTEVHCRHKDARMPVVPTEITSVLSSSSTPPPAVTNTETCPVDPAPTGSATATSTDLSTDSAAKSDSGCNLSAGRAVHSLGPWTVVLAGLLLVSLRRRRR